MKDSNNTRIVWLKWTVFTVSFLVLIYILMHSLDKNGHQKKLLNKDQIATINTIIINSTDTTIDVTKGVIKDYLQKNFDIIDSSNNVLALVENRDLNQLQLLLPTYPILVKSYFWLNDPWVLLEIVFWSLFGLLANLLFSVTSAVDFDPRRIPEHIGKFFYTPFLAIIIYLSLNALVNSGEIVFNGIGSSVIVISFVLGFYTRRSIVLLGRVKDLLLPAKSRESNSNKDVYNNNEESGDFIDLPKEEQKRIINEFIKSEAHILKENYPIIQGFSARPKKINNEEQNYYCLHIDIYKKEKQIEESRKIPGEVSFVDSKGFKYNIQTDISGVGKNELEYSKSAKKFIGEHQMPKQLGLSCSREGVDAIGSIGLKVYKNNDKTPYLLSCFHVLCSTELNNHKNIYNSSAANNNSTIVSPGTNDCKKTEPTSIALLSEGVLNNHIDIALAKLHSDDLLQNTIYNYNGRINGVINLTSDDVRKRKVVYLYGRTSGEKKGFVKDNYQGIVYFDDYPGDTLKKGEMWNLIVTSKISQKGDSGAPVVDSNNRVIGILVGSNSAYSFVMPISTIINKLNINGNKLNKEL